MGTGGLLIIDVWRLSMLFAGAYTRVAGRLPVISAIRRDDDTTRRAVRGISNDKLLAIALAPGEEGANVLVVGGRRLDPLPSRCPRYTS